MSGAALLLPLFGVAGFFVGLAYFLALRRNVRLYLGSSPVWHGIALHVARILAVAVLFAVTAQAGAWALVNMLTGFLVARAIAFRVRVRQT